LAQSRHLPAAPAPVLAEVALAGRDQGLDRLGGATYADRHQGDGFRVAASGASGVSNGGVDGVKAGGCVGHRSLLGGRRCKGNRGRGLGF
jgi:hypothetical protein